MSVDRRSLLGHALALVALLSVPHLLSAALGAALRTWETTGHSPWWFPELWSVGATAARYAQVVDLVSSVVVPLSVFALGVRLGRSLRAGEARGDDSPGPDARGDSAA
jgi:predicted permease